MAKLQTKPNLNALCPCNSGLKYKRCCAAKKTRLSHPATNPWKNILFLSISLACLLNCVMIFKDHRFSAPFLENTDYINEAIHRVQTAKPSLKELKVVGYLDDHFGPVDPSNVEANIQYHLFQYALAPLIVAADYNRTDVIGNFRKSPDPSKIRALGFTISADLGQGIYLLKKKDAV